MKQATTFLAVTSVVALLAFDASADVKEVKALPNGRSVTLSGTVDSVSNEREFILSDPSGKLDVQIAGNSSVVLEKGVPVTVAGVVNQGLLGTTLEASSVDVKKAPLDKVGDVIDTVTGGATTQAKNVMVNTLPDAGMVRVMGTVKDVSDEKNFTLADQTGKVDVKIESNEAAVVTKGAEVTVIGTVDNGLMGKRIAASHVIVRADASRMTDRK